MKPYFSIIVTVYNAERYLSDFLASIACQTFANWECLCIDDGSKDGSAEILDKMADKDARFVVIHKTNEGVGKARNVGLDRARGDWITWADADDELAPTRLEAAHRILETENPDFLQLWFKMGNTKPVGFERTPVGMEYKIYNGPDAYEFAWKEMHPNGMLWLGFAPRRMFEGLRYREEMRVKGDCFLSSALYPRMMKLCVGTHDGYFYRMTPGSIIRSKRHAKDCMNVLAAYLDLWNDQKNYAQSIGKLSILQWRIQRGVGTNVIDWMLGRPENEDRQLCKKVHQTYRMVARSGAFACRWTQDKRYWPWFIFYEKWGLILPTVIADRVYALGGRVLRSIGLK